MTRFPINFLLFLTSGALALACAWTFYQTMNRDAGKSQQEVWEEAEALQKAGRAQTPDDKRDDYSERSQVWWKTFQQANFIGKPPPEAPKPAEQVVEQPKTPENFKVESILDVMFILYSSTGESWCAVRYKPEADVIPPKDEKPGTYSGPGDAVAQPQPNANRPAPGQAGASPMPGGRVDGGLMQILTVGDALWPRYEHVKLLRVDESGEAVFFAIGQEEGADEEKLFRNELGLAQEVLEALAGGPSASTGAPRQPRPQPPESAPDSTWIDVEETRAVRPGQWHISRDDDDFLRENAQEVFNKDVSLRSYVSKGGTVRGLQVTRVSPRLARFGVQQGDVILELNGVPVSSKAQALKVGKEQHRQGVRTFRAKIMSRWGKIEERTYHTPDK